MSSNYLLRKVADKYMLIPIGESQGENRFIINMNKTGAFILEKYDEGCTVDEIITAIIEKYGITKELATTDVNNFLDYLRSKSVIE